MNEAIPPVNSDITTSQLNERLTILRAEYEKGEQVLADMAREEQQLREQLLRIAGAIHVLEELLETITVKDDNA